MATSLLIEEGKEKDFIALVELPQDEIALLVKRLHAFKYGSSLSNVSISLADQNSYAPLLIALYQIYISLSESTDAFLDRIYNTYRNYSPPNLLDEPPFKQKMKALFLADNPVLNWINTIVQSEEIHPLFVNVKIFTEVRPIMKLGTEAEVIDSKVYNYMKISYEDEDESRDLFIGTSRENLLAIRKEIDRAIVSYEAIERKYKTVIR